MVFSTFWFVSQEYGRAGPIIRKRAGFTNRSFSEGPSEGWKPALQELLLSFYAKNIQSHSPSEPPYKLPVVSMGSGLTILFRVIKPFRTEKTKH